MIHNYIHNNSDAVLVGSVNKSFKFLGGTEVFVCFGVVENIVTVVRIMCKSLAGIAITVNLLIRSRNPQSIYAEVIKVTLLD